MTEPEPEQQTADLLPPRSETEAGKPRRIGVEIELAGLTGEELAKCVAQVFGGEIRQITRYELQVVATRVGEFKLELDSAYLKKIERTAAEKVQSGEDSEEWLAELENISSDLLTLAATQFVPWEIVSPPMNMADLGLFDSLTDLLRERGARGTRHAARFAFGVHLNPELPALDCATILSYLRAYLCLYDWLADREQIDLSRRLTSYIRHFGRDYIALVTDPQYSPDLATLIDDYLKFNPSRNRSLDMLPLFAFLDEPRVRAVVDDPRVKQRPTLHYRLPNCDVDNPDWNLGLTWSNWLQVERLAGDGQRLKEMCEAFQLDLDRLVGRIDNAWLEHTKQFLDEPAEASS